MTSVESAKVSAKGHVTVRQLKEDDINDVVNWTTKEHWHVSYNIVKANYLADPNGFFAACDQDGRLIGQLHPKCFILL